MLKRFDSVICEKGGHEAMFELLHYTLTLLLVGRIERGKEGKSFSLIVELQNSLL